MALELRHWRAFATAAETVHFGLAAEQLGITQSALSQLIKTVEGHLGARLFDRSRQRVHLTEAGRTLLPEARALLAQGRKAEQTGLVVGRSGNRMLAVGYVGSVVLHPHFVALMRSLTAARPTIALRLDQSSVTDQVRLLTERQLDLGLLRSPVPQVEPEIAFARLARDHMIVALPETHPLAQDSGPCALSCLADEPFIQFRRQQSGGLNQLIRNACAEAGFEPRVAQTVPQIATILCLVGAGLGVALVPETARRLGVPGLVYRGLETPIPTDLNVMYRRADTAPALREALHAVRRLDKDS